MLRNGRTYAFANHSFLLFVDLYLSNSFVASFIIRDTYNIPNTITKQLLILKVVSEINI